MSYMRRVVVVNAAKYDMPIVYAERLYSFLHGFALGQIMPTVACSHFLKHDVPELLVDKQSWRNSEHLYQFKGRRNK